MSVEMDTLEAAVTKIHGAADSAVKLIKDTAAYIKANAADPVKLKAFADDLLGHATDLGDAVAANPLPA